MASIVPSVPVDSTPWASAGSADDLGPCSTAPGFQETLRVLLPTTAPGRWSILAVAVFGVLLAVFALAVAAGQRGGEEFFDNLWLTVPFLGAYLAGVSALVLGVVAMTAFGERSVIVVAATILGLLITAFGVLEVLFPH